MVVISNLVLLISLVRLLFGVMEAEKYCNICFQNKMWSRYEGCMEHGGSYAEKLACLLSCGLFGCSGPNDSKTGGGELQFHEAR